MNKKILLIATLVLMTIVSLGAVSAADDAVDDSIAADAGDIVIADGEGGETPDPTVINIAAGTSAEDIQATFDDLTDNTIVNFEEGEYNLGTQGLKINKTIKTQEQELDDEGNPRSCSRYKYVLESIEKEGKNIQIIEFDEFLSLLGLTKEELNSMPTIDVDYLMDDKYKKVVK